MAESYANLAQQKPAAGVLANLLAVGGGGLGDVVTSIVVCNQSGSSDTYRLSHAPGNAADSPEQYFAFDVTLPAFESKSIAWTSGFSMAPTDRLRCRSAKGNISFNVYGCRVA
jgi:hypothetical protein